ncbi:MAG: threonylcarbamoyl-AMP synthase [Lachnospiraceae bacterium]|nr:threonylcarbamoyl-AMP synthase [Lachnospiraceae bacterium]
MTVAYGELKKDEALLKKAAELIGRGELVAIPTETVYGLAGNALDPTAAGKIYAAKGRPSDNPLIVHICKWEDIELIARDIPKEAGLLAEKYWPGPLTMVLKKTGRVPKETTGGLDTVAVRMPVNEIAREFIDACGGYIAAPSANTSGRPSCTTAGHVYEDLNGKIPLIIDGGPVGIGVESTIIDLTGDNPVLLRPGYISLEELREILPDIKADPHIDGAEEEGDFKPKAPGMKYKHYAPKGQLTIVKGEPDRVVSYINERCEEHDKNRESCAVLCNSSRASSYKAEMVFSLGFDQEEIAHNLFAALRETDDRELKYIYSESFEGGKLGMAIMNRLTRAAGHKITEV